MLWVRQRSELNSMQDCNFCRLFMESSAGLKERRHSIVECIGEQHVVYVCVTRSVCVCMHVCLCVYACMLVVVHWVYQLLSPFCFWSHEIAWSKLLQRLPLTQMSQRQTLTEKEIRQWKVTEWEQCEWSIAAFHHMVCYACPGHAAVPSWQAITYTWLKHPVLAHTHTCTSGSTIDNHNEDNCFFPAFTCENEQTQSSREQRLTAVTVCLPVDHQSAFIHLTASTEMPDMPSNK